MTNKPTPEQINRASEVAAQLRVASFAQRCQEYRAAKASPSPSLPSRPSAP